MHAHTPALGLGLHVVHALAVKKKSKDPRLQQHTDNTKCSNKYESQESQYQLRAPTARTYVRELTITSSMMLNPYPEAHEISHSLMESKGSLCY
jgi:hypothetical protein